MLLRRVLRVLRPRLLAAFVGVTANGIHDRSTPMTSQGTSSMTTTPFGLTGDDGGRASAANTGTESIK
jgi:hypothetical protein